MAAASSLPGLPSENQLRARIGVSRTTVRKVLRELTVRGIVVERDGAKFPAARSSEDDLYSGPETTSRNEHVEQQFMEWMLRGGVKPGTLINELELARQFGVATNGIREFLIRFSRFGLVEKKTEFRLALQRLHGGLRAGVVRDPHDVRAAIGAPLC